MVQTSILEINTKCSDIAFRSCPSELYINDKFIGHTPIQIFLPVGDYRYKLIRSGYLSPPSPPIPKMAGMVNIKEGARLTLDIDLINPTMTGGLSIGSSPVGAEIFMDSEDQKVTTPAKIPLITPGDHTFWLRLAGYEDITGIFTANPGQDTSIHIHLVQLKDYGTVYFYPIPYLYGRMIPFILEGAKIYIDGVDTGKILYSRVTGLTNELVSITGLTKGVHTFRIERSGTIDREGIFVINGGDVLMVGVHPILQPKTGMLAIEVAPLIGDTKIANVYIDGKDMGQTTGIRYAIPEGMHTYTLKLEGYEDVGGTFEIKTNRITHVTPYMKQIGTVSMGKVNISSNPPWSSVLIDDIYLGKYTPVTIENLSDGDYTYRIIKPGYTDATGTFTISKGGTVDLNPSLTQSDTVLNISCNVIATKIYIDDKDMEQTTPAQIVGLSPGDHIYRLTMPYEYGNGFEDAIGTFKLEEKKTTTINIDVHPIKESGGTLIINSFPVDAKVFIDGIDMKSVTPHNEISISPGIHTITLTLEGYQDWTGTTYVNPGSMEFIFETLLPLQTMYTPYVQNSHTPYVQNNRLEGGSLLVVTVPPNAEVILDGKLIQRGGEPVITPILISDIPAGRHRLTLTLPGYVDQDIDIDLAEGGYLKVTLEMYHKIPYQQTKMASYQIENMQESAIIAVSVPPGASVYIDGTPILEQPGRTPMIAHNLPAGPHMITFRLPGYFDEIINVSLPPGGYMEVATRLRSI